MQESSTKDANGTAPTPGASGICSACRDEIIAKCGEIVEWHWAHRVSSACVGNSVGMWHGAWQDWALDEGAELEVKMGRQIADAVWPDGRIMEFQSDYLDPKSIRSREAQYGEGLTWVYRWDQERWNRLWNAGEGWFRWSKPAKSMLEHERPVMIHHRDRLYEVEFLLEDDVFVRFGRGEADAYGPVLYGSDPAPFDVADAAVVYQKRRARS